MKNILSIDVEEWYHPEYVRDKATANKEEHVTKSLNKTLQLLNKHDANATFFIVGELGERYPEIIEKIREEGHEIAFHGYYHEPLWKLDAKILESEMGRFASLIGEKCLGFRAPSFSLNNKTRWALKTMNDFGYVYDSSIFPTKTSLYGVPTAPTRPYKISLKDVSKEDPNEKLWEFPLLVSQMFGLRIPVAGGFYLRLLPVRMIRNAIRRMNVQHAPAVIYVHPWELDSETPKLKLGPLKSFATYHGRDRILARLEHLLSSFSFASIRDYIEDEHLV